MNIYQHIVEFNSNDGIGNDILGIKNLADFEGINNKIITNKNKTNLSEIDVLHSKDLKKLKFKSSDYHIFHYGSTGYPIREFRNLPGKKILRFHNLTPYHYNYQFCSADDFKTLKISYQKSIMEIQSLSFDIDEYWFDSTFNQETFVDLLNRNINNKKRIVVPIFRNYKLHHKDISQEKIINILFTGRIVPHKKIEDILIILFNLLKLNSNYRLILVGKQSDLFKNYKNFLDSIIKELNLNEFIEWHCDISENTLYEIRKKSFYYLTMSEHEGFCIPILESFAAGIPVIAYNAGSVPETMRNAGIILNQKNHFYIANLLDSITMKMELLKKIQNAQFEVIKSYRNNCSLVDLLK